MIPPAAWVWKHHPSLSRSHPLHPRPLAWKGCLRVCVSPIFESSPFGIIHHVSIRHLLIESWGAKTQFLVLCVCVFLQICEFFFFPIDIDSPSKSNLSLTHKHQTNPSLFRVKYNSKTKATRQELIKDHLLFLVAVPLLVALARHSSFRLFSFNFWCVSLAVPSCFVVAISLRHFWCYLLSSTTRIVSKQKLHHRQDLRLPSRLQIQIPSTSFRRQKLHPQRDYQLQT